MEGKKSVFIKMKSEKEETMMTAKLINVEVSKIKVVLLAG